MFSRSSLRFHLALFLQLQLLTPLTVNGIQNYNKDWDDGQLEQILIVGHPSSGSGLYADNFQEFQNSHIFKRFTEEEHAEEDSESQNGPFNLPFKVRYHKAFDDAMKLDGSMEQDEPIDTEELWLRENIMMHNVLRKRHRNPSNLDKNVSLELDYKLCYHAQTIANSLTHRSFETNSSVLRHQYSQTEGENSGSRYDANRHSLMALPGTFPVRNWYKELASHSWNPNQYSWKSGHFSQLVWDSSKKIGCGRMITEITDDKPKPLLVMVCRYSPPGNYRLRAAYEDHVHPPLDESGTAQSDPSEWNKLPDLKAIEREVIEEAAKVDEEPGTSEAANGDGLRGVDENNSDGDGDWGVAPEPSGRVFRRGRRSIQSPSSGSQDDHFRFRRLPGKMSDKDEQKMYKKKWHDLILKNSKRTKRFVEEESMSDAVHEIKQSTPLNFVPWNDKLQQLSRKTVTREWLGENMNYQNRMREMHVAPPLKLDYKLCYDAQVRADAIAKQHSGKNKIDFGNFLAGDNELAQKAKPNGGNRSTLLHLDGSFAASKWYDEILEHNWAKNVFNESTRHATQTIWISSTAVGCGRAVTTNRKAKPFLIIICRYSPPGNTKTVEAFKKNVNPATENAEPE